MLIGIETSTKYGGIALADAHSVRGRITFAPDRPASVHLIPGIRQLCSDCAVRLQDIEGFAVAIGPGSFTGLRVGLTAAKTLAFHNDKPLYCIPSLDVLVLPCVGMMQKTVALIDARKGEVYGAIYASSDRLHRMTPYQVCDVETLLKNLSDALLVGDGVEAYRSRIEPFLGDTVAIADESLRYGDPVSVVKLALSGNYPAFSGEKLFAIRPLYIRKSEAEVQWKKKHG